MFEQVTQRKRRNPLPFLLGCAVMAGLILFAVVAPKLWPAEIPKNLLAKASQVYAPAMPGKPLPPHVKIVDVPRGGGPRMPSSRRPFVAPPLVEPRAVPQGPPIKMTDIPEVSGLPEVPGVTVRYLVGFNRFFRKI